ncbi:hypothetical protein TNCT_450271, partial [Trichonephila clavata]
VGRRSVDTQSSLPSKIGYFHNNFKNR